MFQRLKTINGLSLQFSPEELSAGQKHKPDRMLPDQLIVVLI